MVDEIICPFCDEEDLVSSNENKEFDYTCNVCSHSFDIEDIKEKEVQ